MTELLRKFIETAGPLIVLALGLLLALSEWQNNILQNDLADIKEAAQQEEINHAKKLSTATDSLVAASREYDAVKSERDTLIARLRSSASAGAKAGTDRACEARVAHLEEMVRDLHRLVEACDGGWHGCAARKDALTETVK